MIYDAYKAQEDDPFIVILPGRVGGTATIGHTRLPAVTVANHYLDHGLDATLDVWDYLHPAEVALACWYVAAHRPDIAPDGWSEWVGGYPKVAWDDYSLPETP